MASFPYVLGQLSNRRPTVPGCFLAMGLSTLSYLPLAAYEPRLLAALGASAARRYGGATAFEPHVLQLDGGGGSVVALEGTRNWQQWLLFVRGAATVQWPHGPGRVFRPFLSIAEPVLTQIADNLAGVANVFVTGHSLGGAVGGLVLRYLADNGQRGKSGHLFGCPRAVDQNFIDASRVTPFVINHPLDPVPLSPPDVTALLISDPYRFSFSTAIRDVGQPFYLPGWADQIEGNSALSTFAALAASAGDFSNCPHQTFRYLRDCRRLLTPEEKQQLDQLATLLEDLGLFDPWPV